MIKIDSNESQLRTDKVIQTIIELNGNPLGLIANLEKDLKKLSHEEAKLEYLETWLQLTHSAEAIKPVLNVLKEKVMSNMMTIQANGLELDHKLYSISEVADKLGCHRSTVYNKHMKEGLKSIDFGDRHQKVKASDLQKYIEMVQNRKRLSN